MGDEEKLQQHIIDKQGKDSDDVPSQRDSEGQTSSSKDHASLQNGNYSPKQQLNKEAVEGEVTHHVSIIACKRCHVYYYCCVHVYIVERHVLTDYYYYYCQSSDHFKLH